MVNAYGVLIARLGLVAGTYADVSRLPFPKPDLREAIRGCLVYGRPSAAQREALGAAYVLLAAFQPGIGPSNRSAADCRTPRLQLTIARADTERQSYRAELMQFDLWPA